MLQFLKQFLIYGCSSVLAKLAAVFLIPVYTNVLSIEEYGAMALIVSCKGVIDLFSNLNIHSGIFREFFEDGVNRKKLVSTGLISILTISLMVLVMLLFSKNFWLESVLGLSLDFELAFVLMLLTIPLGSTVSFFSVLTRYQKKPVTYSIINICQLLVQISTTVFFIVYQRIGITGVFIGLLAGEIFAIIALYLINRKFLVLKYDFKIIKQALIYSIPTLPAILAGWVDTSFGQILIGRYTSLSDLGIYSLALQLASVFTIIGVAMGQVWAPYVFENYKKSTFNRDLQNIYKLFLIVIILVIINVSLLSEDIILLLSDRGYLGASEYFVLLSFPMGVFLMMPFVQSGILISKKTKYLGLYAIVGSSINLLLMIILLPKYGIVVVPISLGVSRLIKYYLFSRFSKKEINLQLPNKLILLLFISTVTCYIVMQLELDKIYIWTILGVVDVTILWIINKKYKLISYIKQKITKND